MREKIFSTIDKLFDHYLKVWEDVCNIESPTDYKKGVDEVSAYFVNLASELGWKVERFKQEKAGDVVTITMNEKADKAPLTLSGHLDTVFPLGTFGTPAVRVENGRMYGPGVKDCKGGVVAGFYAMHVLQEIGFKDRPIRLALQTDEEVGSSVSEMQTINHICEGAKGSVAFINLEGGDYGEICLVRKGILTAEIEIIGQEAHSSKCAVRGANAIVDAAHKIIELDKFKDDNGLTCNCAIINGGTKTNIVAGKCNLNLNIRYATEEQYQKMLKYLQELVKIQHVRGCTSELKIINRRPSMELVDRNIKLLDTMNDIFAKYGLERLKLGRRTGGSDAAYVTVAGIPCVDSIGVKGDHIHSVKEYADIESFRDSVTRLAVVGYEI